MFLRWLTELKLRLWNQISLFITSLPFQTYYYPYTRMQFCIETFNCMHFYLNDVSKYSATLYNLYLKYSSLNLKILMASFKNTSKLHVSVDLWLRQYYDELYLMCIYIYIYMYIILGCFICPNGLRFRCWNFWSCLWT